MQIQKLIADDHCRLLTGEGDCLVRYLTDDSRQARPGSLFIARPAVRGDIQAYIADAVARGAVAVLTEPAHAPTNLPQHVVVLTADRVDQRLAGRLAERFYGYPSRKLKLVAVTGTNGKTTTAFILRHLLRQSRMPTGIIGTIETDVGAGRVESASLTTPGAIEFSQLLAQMVDNGCQAAVAEVSSHALDQGRTAALQFDVAVFTNLTGDHLDYHGSIDEYARAKALLFQHLSPQACAVLNADDAYATRMTHQCTAKHVWTTLRQNWAGTLPAEEANVLVCEGEILSLDAEASRVRFDGPWGSLNVRLPLVGRHNVSNALQATAAMDILIPMARQLRLALESCPAVPGRLEPVPNERFPLHNQPHQADRFYPHLPSVLVDYAHTHDALENVLLALRPVTRGQLIVLFGCGGDRDATKRPKMAQVACRLADEVIVTSDNPRTEDAQAIIDDILAGIPAERKHAVTVIPDRAQAIRRAIMHAHVADTVLLAGKGHEDYQILGQEKHPFDDRQHAVRALARWQEPTMPADVTS